MKALRILKDHDVSGMAKSGPFTAAYKGGTVDHNVPEAHADELIAAGAAELYEGETEGNGDRPAEARKRGAKGG